VFRALPQAHLNLEIKTAGAALSRPLCELIREYGMEQRVAVAALDQEAMDGFRSACPKVATSATKDEVIRFVGLRAVFLSPLFEPRAQAFQVPEAVGGLAIVTPGFAREARHLNMKLEVWTVNRADDMQRLLALPVDGIMTDYPDRLLGLLGR
jgi:glycerophosphoryl diester phosphodiesterase